MKRTKFWVENPKSVMVLTMIALTDENDSGLVDGFMSYIDSDGDGYGHDSSLSVTCDIVENRTFNGGDCMDSNPNIYLKR